jgi:uncharacterized protein GlcG (DUF336 family)
MRCLPLATSIALISVTCSLLGKAANAPPPTAAEPIVQKHSISMEAALAIARVALEAGAAKGSQVAVVVVDQAGIPLVLLRADHGTEQFVEGATQKAWTSVNFRASTREIFEDIQKGKEDFSQLPHVPKALFLMGGVPLKEGARVVGGLGVAGAVSGLEDDVIAREGAEAFAKLLKK